MAYGDPPGSAPSDCPVWIDTKAAAMKSAIDNLEKVVVDLIGVRDASTQDLVDELKRRGTLRTEKYLVQIAKTEVREKNFMQVADDLEETIKARIFNELPLDLLISSDVNHYTIAAEIETIELGGKVTIVKNTQPGGRRRMSNELLNIAKDIVRNQHDTNK